MKRILFLGLGIVVLLASCVKKKGPAPDAHVRFVNAVSFLPAQDIYIDNVLATTTGGVSFGGVTNYFTYESGINLLTYNNTGTTTPNLSYTYGSSGGEYATVFFYSDTLQNIYSAGIKDNMSAPPTGKARVRFVNLDNYLKNALKMTVTGGADLFTSLDKGNASSYYDVDPGATFTPSSVGVTNAPVINPQVQAGKIYTIWLSATSSTELVAHNTLQN